MKVLMCNGGVIFTSTQEVYSYAMTHFKILRLTLGEM